MTEFAAILSALLFGFILNSRISYLDDVISYVQSIFVNDLHENNVVVLA